MFEWGGLFMPARRIIFRVKLQAHRISDLRGECPWGRPQICRQTFKAFHFRKGPTFLLAHRACCSLGFHDSSISRSVAVKPPCQGLCSDFTLEPHAIPKNSCLLNRHSLVRSCLDYSAESSSASMPPTQLNKADFSKVIKVKALKLPKQLCHRYVKLLRSALLIQPQIKAVQTDDTDPAKRIVLLHEGIKDLESPELPPGLKTMINKDGVEEVTHVLHLNYDRMSMDMILKELFPADWEIPSSFETVGHIAHLNLRDEYLPYKHLIGQVVLDKNLAIKTVVNKTGSIENEYRVLPMEIIAGENKLETTVKQQKARFRLNFAEVYWNSRLEQEHSRLVQIFRPGEVIADVMAGIGPFAIFAGLQGNKVLANDLNPRSVHYLRENIKLNKVEKRVEAFEMDGRDFIHRLCGSGAELCQHSEQGMPLLTGCTHCGLAARVEDGSANGVTETGSIPRSGVCFAHAVMNLPSTALHFLDAFKGAFNRGTWANKALPLVHAYTFAKSTEAESDIRKRTEHHLGGPLEGDSEFSMRLVRDVAPNKRMLCVSFRVPEAVAFASSRTCEEETAAKKQKIAASET